MWGNESKRDSCWLHEAASSDMQLSIAETCVLVEYKTEGAPPLYFGGAAAIDTMKGHSHKRCVSPPPSLPYSPSSCAPLPPGTHSLLTASSSAWSHLGSKASTEGWFRNTQYSVQMARCGRKNATSYLSSQILIPPLLAIKLKAHNCQLHGGRLLCALYTMFIHC